MPVGSVFLSDSGKMLARRCGTPPRQGKQSVWTPTAKGGRSQTHLFLGQKPRAYAPPTFITEWR